MSRWGVRITRIQVIYVFSIKSHHAIGSIGDPLISDNPHLRLGALLEVEISKKCTRMWREARFEVNMLKAHHFRTTFGRWTVVLCGKGQGFCTLRKVRKTWGFCRICKKRWHAWDVGRGSAMMHFRVAGAVQETSPSDDARTSELWFPEGVLFPRASERRVLPIVGVCISSSHLHTFSSSHLLSHLLIFTSSHLHICSSSHLLIFTSSHLHTFSSSHLLIFTSSHLHICSSSHLLIFTSSYLHIFSSSHLLIFTYSHLHILTSSRSLSLSRTHTLTYSHLLSLSLLFPLLSVSPFSLPFLSLAFFIFLSLGRGWCRRGVTKREPFRTKWGSIGKNWGKIAILLVLEQPFRTKWGSIVKNWGKLHPCVHFHYEMAWPMFHSRGIFLTKGGML